MEYIIFGLGGVGSWLTEMLTRLSLDPRYSEQITKLTLVDFDVIEQKNMLRQNYMPEHVNVDKTTVLETYMHSLNPSLDISSDNIRISSETNLLRYDEKATALVCTDNIASKHMIANYFFKTIIINCDKDYINISNHIPTEDKDVWILSNGYTSKQDLISNITSVAMVLPLLFSSNPFNRGPFSITYQPETKVIEMMKENIVEQHVKEVG